MDTLHIRRLQHHSHIRGHATAAVRARVAGAFAAMLEEGLEAALLRAGIDLEEEICIRRVHMRNTLSLARSDRQLAMDLSMAWAGELQQLIQNGGAAVIRYRSRLHVLIEMAAAVVSGDTSRAWAWRQLGLWPKDVDVPKPRAVALLVDVLARHATAVVPVFSSLARANRLANLVASLEGAQVTALAIAALDAMSLPSSLLSAMPHVVFSDGSNVNSMQAAAGIARAIEQSPLTPAFTASADTIFADTPVANAAAVLVLLAMEPAILLVTQPERSVQYAAAQLRAIAGLAPYSQVSSQLSGQISDQVPDQAFGRKSDQQPVRKSNETRSSQGDDSYTRIREDAPSDPAQAATSPITGTASLKAANKLAKRMESDAETRRETPPLMTNNSATDAVSEDEPAQDKKFSPEGQFWQTEWGGALFLLCLVEPSGVLELVAGDEELQARGVRWFLYRLALQLLPLAVDDPVAFAFCGVAPAEWRALIDAAPPTEAQAKKLEFAVTAVVAELRAHLGDHSTGVDLLLHTTCKRDARLTFDPGWIEARFSLDSVSISIRRGGLDRNPDWLPWLGAVVRFVYE